MTVFVVQLKGKKNWQLKPHVGELPALYSDLIKPLDVGPTEHIVLEPGDILYIPRGTPHCADTRGLDEGSIHLTIGVEIEAQFAKRELVRRLVSQQTHTEAHTHLREHVEAALEAKSSQDVLQGGLMAWHLASDSALRKEAESLLNGLSDGVACHVGATSAKSDPTRECRAFVTSALDNDTTALLPSLRSVLLEDRRSFLSSREELAGRFVSLHRCLDAPPPAESNSDDDAEERDSSSSRAHKKARHSD